MTERNPVPTGVVIGALRATLVRRHDSMTLSGTGVPSLAMMSTPASSTSHWMSTPVASMQNLVASASSGPTPSPGIRVTTWAMFSDSPSRRNPVGDDAPGMLIGSWLRSPDPVGYPGNSRDFTT